MADISIVIKRNSSAESNSDVTQEGNADNVQTNKAGKGETSSDKVVRAALVQAGKKVLGTAVSQYGNLTGDYITQSKIESVMNVAADVATVAVAGPVVGGIMIGTKYAVNAATSFIEQRKANNTIQMLAERNGNIVNNGGRGTYD